MLTQEKISEQKIIPGIKRVTSNNLVSKIHEAKTGKTVVRNRKFTIVVEDFDTPLSMTDGMVRKSVRVLKTWPKSINHVT